MPSLPTKEAVVAYLDILGISNEIKNSGLKSLELLLKLGPNFINTNEKAQRYDIRGFYFADSFVFVTPTEQIDRNLPHLFLTLRFIHDKAIENGFLVRGAITIGEIYFPERNDGIFLGKAYLKAYELESQIAIYPRIILDWPLVNKIKKIQANPFGKGELHNFIKEDFDGLYFLDFFDPNVIRYNNEDLKRVEDSFVILPTGGENSKKLKKLKLKILCNFLENFCSDRNKFLASNRNNKIFQKYCYLIKKIYRNCLEFCECVKYYCRVC